MSEPNKPCPFKRCDGSGKVRLNERSDEFCLCHFQEDLKRKISIIRTSKVKVQSSPLCGKGEIDRTRENLLLRGSEDDFDLPHLRLALSYKLLRNVSFRFAVIHDERLKNVWVGNEAYNQRSRKKRDDQDTTNGLSDLLGESYDLVIIELGIITAKNIEMPRILREALMLRAALSKGTWLVERPRRPFDYVSDYRSYDETVDSYIEQRFKVVELDLRGAIPIFGAVTQPKPTPDMPPDDDDADENGDIEFSAPAAATPKVPKAPEKRPSRPDHPKPAPEPTDMGGVYLPQAMLGDLEGKRKKGWRP